jgi:WD40 repeat protein
MHFTKSLKCIALSASPIHYHFSSVFAASEYEWDANTLIPIASPHSLPSLDGKYVATVLSSSIIVRSVALLEIIRNIKLPSDLSGGVTNFVWSPSSTRVLIAFTDQLHVFSAPGGTFHGVVQIPRPLAAKSAFVTFGATDDEVCIFSPIGTKLTIVNLASSKAVEIANPKFFSTMSALKGCSFRPNTCHMAVLTRAAGKDMISIHNAETREIQRSWCPETVDAQGLAWTPDGRWLVVWDSPAHGTKVLFCTPDGHVFRDWHGGQPQNALDDMDQYGPGVRTLGFSQNGRYTAISDGPNRICMLNDRFVEEARLHHAEAVEPKETLQVGALVLGYYTGCYC